MRFMNSSLNSKTNMETPYKNTNAVKAKCLQLQMDISIFGQKSLKNIFT